MGTRGVRDRRIGELKSRAVMKRPASVGSISPAKRPAAQDQGLHNSVVEAARPSPPANFNMHLWLIRHGETENNVLMRQMAVELESLDRLELKRRYNRARASDPALSCLGQEQVEKLPEHPALAPLVLSGRPVDIYASPLRRAIETAAPLQRILPNSPAIRLRADLSEIGGMHCHTEEGDKVNPGKTPEELLASYPHLTLDTSEVNGAGWWAGRAEEDTTSGSGCQASWDRVGRVAAWARQLRPTTADVRDIAIVGHGALFSRVVPELLGMPRGSGQVSHGNTGVTHLELSGKSFTRVHCMNVLPANASPL